MNRQELEYIIDEYQHKLYRYCYQMVRCKETAEDIVQEVFIKYYQLSKNKKEYNKSYLYSIAHSKCIDLLRRKKLEKLNIVKFHKKTYEPSVEDNMMEDICSKEIEMILCNLSPYEKSVLLLRAVQELSYKEISEILDKNENTIRKQYNRVQIKVRNKLLKGDVQSEKTLYV
ncbi:RNA polymerase sigma factor [Clostridiaceae bacterium M8S5]|nr:RNA polymerase sigma factor [Clostridiaceae bacterium M8S5]